MRRPPAQNDLSMSTDVAKEVEVFPGIHERRYFLRSSFATAAALVALGAMPRKILGQAPVKGAGPMGADRLSWDDFLKQSITVAQQLIIDPAFSIDEYLYRIGSLATRLKEIPDSVLGSYTAVDPRVWFGPSFKGSPVFIIQWRMEPGASCCRSLDYLDAAVRVERRPSNYEFVPTNSRNRVLELLPDFSLIRLVNYAEADHCAVRDAFIAHGLLIFPCRHQNTFFRCCV